MKNFLFHVKHIFRKGVDKLKNLFTRKKKNKYATINKSNQVLQSLNGDFDGDVLPMEMIKGDDKNDI